MNKEAITMTMLQFANLIAVYFSPEIFMNTKYFLLSTLSFLVIAIILKFKHESRL